MPLKIKTSKFRHVFGQPTRKENCFENIRITKNAHDSNFCAVNPKFIAVVLESVGGGSFVVLPIKQIGRVDINAPKVCGHSAPITDIKWNPFDDHVIASSSDDLTIKVWEIPELGLHSNMTNYVVELRGHGRRVTYIEWHPTAENILLSCAFDYRCIVWDVAHASPLNVISCHGNTIYSISWSPNGSLFATTCKDKKIRVIDPRTGCVLQEGAGHDGLKASKVVFMKNSRLFTTGFSKCGDRQISLWNTNDLTEPLFHDSIDYTSGVLLPYYDSDVNLVYLAGKGDGNIRYFEVQDRTVIFLNEYSSSDPQRGLGQMPKRGLDVSKCEIARFYKLHTNKQIIEPLPMVVPRRSDEFAEDIYPPTLAANPALTAEEWISGIDREPVTVSVKPRRRRPKNDLMAIIELAERGNTSEPSRVGSLRAFTKSQQRTQVVKPVQKTPQASPPPKNAPASLQNMYKLCTDTSKVSLQVEHSKPPQPSQPAETVQPVSHDESPPASNLLPSQVRQQQQHRHHMPHQQQHTQLQQQHTEHQQQHTQHQQQHTQPQQQHTQQQQQYTQQQQFVQQQQQQQMDPSRTAQPIQQAHVRPTSQTESPRYQYQQSSALPSQPHQQMYQQMQPHKAAQNQPHSSEPSQQQYTQYHEHEQAIYSGSSHQQQPRIYQQEQHSGQPLKWKNNMAWQKPATPVGGTFERSPSTQFKVIGHNSSPRHSRQVSAPIVPQMQPKQPINGSHSSTLSNDELHKAYFKQCEEIKHLRKLNQTKEKKIETLEKELGQLKKMIISL